MFLKKYVIKCSIKLQNCCCRPFSIFAEENKKYHIVEAAVIEQEVHDYDIIDLVKTDMDLLEGNFLMGENLLCDSSA